MTITWMTFAVRLLVGFFLAVGIGIERQWLKTRAVLKTNVLVTLGSAMFVMLSIMVPGDSSPTRIASQIVSGVGFLGGGVILRQGASVKGINTAATLWCAAAIGTLVGSGFLVQAYVSTVAVVGANLLLRPLVEAFKQRDEEDEIVLGDRRLETTEQYYGYSCCLSCSLEVEAQVLASAVRFAREKELITTMMESRNIIHNSTSEPTEVEIKINFASKNAAEKPINSEEIVLLLKTETKVNSVAWKLLAKNA